MNIEFVKYHGTGNDFIIIDGFSYPDINSRLSPDIVSRLCDRHFGIGADGLMILVPHAQLDFTMIYYNSDGHISSMCGNGGRCIVHYAHRLGYIGDECVFEAIDGEHSARVNDLVTLKMKDVDSLNSIADDVELDTGSPHYVKIVGSVDVDDFVDKARSIRMNEKYIDEGINVNFVQINGDHINVRTFERGVEDETLSCGTGVVASAIVASKKSDGFTDNVKIKTRGGELSVRFNSSNGVYTDVYLTGPAQEVFRGSFKID